MSEVALTAAMRTNLLTLQSTQEGIDKQQAILATGRKVNSALDNPSSFFKAQSLTNRANDLSALLDGMGQSISTIKQADKAVSSVTKLVEQAGAIADQALTESTNATSEAKVVGNVDLSNVNDVTDLVGVTNAGGDTLNIKVTAADGTLALDDSVTLSAGDSIEQIVTKINDLNDTNNVNAISAKLNDAGQLEITSTNGGNMSIEFVTANDTDAENVAMAAALGFGQAAEIVENGVENAGAQENDVLLTAVSGTAMTSVALYDASDSLADASDALTSLFTERTASTNLIAGNDATDDLVVGVNGGTAKTYNIDGLTVQGLVDSINDDFSGQIQASFDSKTGQISIRAVDAGVETVQFGVREQDATASGMTARFGFGVQQSVTATQTSVDITSVESIRFGAAAKELARLEGEYNNIRTQIDQLVSDAGYQGVNLLKGDDLTTTFNEDRTSSLTTNGVTFSSAGLGIGAANFASATSINSSMADARGALDQVRSFGESLANNLSVIQTRQDFTKDTINNLKEGSDKLTLADKNEEGAKLLALQTQQQLGTISLSMASQSAQSVLRLF